MGKQMINELLGRISNFKATMKGNVSSSISFMFLILIVGIVSIVFILFALLNEKFVALAPNILGQNASASFNSTVLNSESLLSTSSSIAILFVLGVVGALIIGALISGVMFIIYSMGGRGGGMSAR